MGMKMKGLRSTLSEVTQIANKTTRAMRRTLDKEGLTIEEMAQENAPVLNNNIEDSIKFESTYDDSRRKTIQISAGGTVNGVNVDEYVELAHEHPQYGTGEASRRKARLTGKILGPKFIDRAVDERMPELIKNLEGASFKK